MKNLNIFEKVSFDEFYRKMIIFYRENLYYLYDDSIIKKMYEEIKLPSKTIGENYIYDFYIPIDIKLRPSEIIEVPMGIHAKIEDDWVLAMFIKDSFNCEDKLQLNKAALIINSSYQSSNNENHIIMPIINDLKPSKNLWISKNDKFVKGIFIQQKGYDKAY